MTKHFSDTRLLVKDLIFRLFMRVCSSSRGILLHYESRTINKYNLVEEGVNIDVVIGNLFRGNQNPQKMLILYGIYFFVINVFN